MIKSNSLSVRFEINKKKKDALENQNPKDIPCESFSKKKTKEPNIDSLLLFFFSFKLVA
jgi:translation elongation factor EF-4